MGRDRLELKGRHAVNRSVERKQLVRESSRQGGSSKKEESIEVRSGKVTGGED